ncbi:DNA-binding protein [Solibacillus sp. NPDC093137]|uniref:DNA-binding protein n=1 Tax=Solibacillus sp. NPDC093137 TaxID=3390678 RepID=UPI003D027C44
MNNYELLNILTKLFDQHIQVKSWFTLKEGAAYAGVSYNTFIKFREMGLKIAEVEGIKRVSRKEIDTFLENHSF